MEVTNGEINKAMVRVTDYTMQADPVAATPRAVFREVLPVLAENEILCNQGTHRDPEGRYILQTTLTHVPSGEKITSECPADDLDYARWSSLATLVGLVTEPVEAKGVPEAPPPYPHTTVAPETLPTLDPDAPSPRQIEAAASMVAMLSGVPSIKALNKLTASPEYDKHNRSLDAKLRSEVRSVKEALIVKLEGE